MRRRLPADEKARRAENQRAGADGRHEARAVRLAAEKGERLVVGEKRVDPCSAGHADHVERPAVGEGRVGLQR